MYNGGYLKGLAKDATERFGYLLKCLPIHDLPPNAAGVLVTIDEETSRKIRDTVAALSIVLIDIRDLKVDQ